MQVTCAWLKLEACCDQHLVRLGSWAGIAAVLVGTTRATDAVCRRRADGFGIVLPETSATAARFVRGRIREQAARAAMGRLGPVTFSTGIVEWRPGETVEAFDARAIAAVEPQSERPLARPG